MSVRRDRPVRLVGAQPGGLGVGRYLNDGVDTYKITDAHVRYGTRWFCIMNIDFPETRPWFSAEDLSELAYGRGPQKDPTNKEQT